MIHSAPHSRTPLLIKLAESAVFLSPRDGPSGEPHLTTDNPGILRGLLVLNVEKPTKISSIVVDLTCTSSSTAFEGEGLAGINITEVHNVFSSQQYFFKAGRGDRRRSSLPPAKFSNDVIHPFSNQADNRTPQLPSALNESVRPRRHPSVAVREFTYDAAERSERHYSPPSQISYSNSLLAQSQLRRAGSDSSSHLDPSHAPESESDDSLLSRGRSLSRHQMTTKDTKASGPVEKIEHYLHLDKEGAVEWKEFKPGVYTYAIRIPIPADQPPTLECDFGSVTWRLEATVHRPGLLTPRLTRSVNIIVVHNTSDETVEDEDSITFERVWEQQLHYLVSLSTRHFYVGGIIPFSITFLPLSKCKIHKINVYIIERVEYTSRIGENLPQVSPCISVPLLLAEYPKNKKPILPLPSDDPDAFRKSPLYQFLGEDDDCSELASNLMGPGPWTLRKNLEIPSSCSVIHWTNRNRKSSVLITHVLKCIIRVERDNGHEGDHKTGKKEFFDLVIHKDIDIRSCRCNPRWAGLPPYTETFQDTRTFKDRCPCQIFGNNQETAMRQVAVGRFTSLPTPIVATASLETALLDLRGNNAFYRNNVQYERLISGQETESGEAPPPYLFTS